MSFRLKCFLVAMPIEWVGLYLHDNDHPFIGSFVIGALVGGLIGLLDD